MSTNVDSFMIRENMIMRDTNQDDIKSSSLILQLGGWTCMIFILYSIATMLIVSLIGGPPETVVECFAMLSENKLTGLLRLDILTVFVMPLYYILFYSLYHVLKPYDKGWITISVIFAFAGVTLFLAAPSTFSYLHLSDSYEGALSEIQKNNLLAAGESILATDIWHGAGPRIGGILIQSGALIISLLMLKNTVFSKLTAWTGIVMHGLDLAHIIAGFFSVVAGNMLMIIAGPLYPVWFLLIGLRFFKLSRNENRAE
jgi:hypothetical protein